MPLTEQQLSNLCDVVITLIYEKGLKCTTMDLVAKRLQISKRTLYENYGGSKDCSSQPSTTSTADSAPTSAA